MDSTNSRAAGAAPSPAPSYRPDVDGLRAVAVWLVLVFHLGLANLPGGYIGVDVFFVISGYVISRMIVGELATTGRFDFARFYIRRALRLLPVMFAISAFVLVMGWFVVGAIDYQAIARSIQYANLFWSNWHFARIDSYFMAEPARYPMLHTWSLAVEEQFYIVAPFVLVALSRWRGWILLVAGVSLASLAYGLYGASQTANWVYYSTLTRVFELGVGILIGTRNWVVPQGAVRMVLATSGLAAILLSALLLSKSVWFPAPLALPAVLGTAALILAGEGADANRPFITRLLSSPVMTLNGRLSYSLYMWHWPLLWAAIAIMGRSLVDWEPWLLLLAVVAVSFASFHLIEAPARRLAPLMPRRGAIGAAVGVALAFGAALVIVRAKGVPARLPVQAATLEREAHERGDAYSRCLSRRNFQCRIGAADAVPSVLIWGDSHMGALAPGFDEVLSDAKRSAIMRGRGGCMPLMSGDWKGPQADTRCTDSHRGARAVLDANPSIRHVVIVSRWAFYPSDEAKKFHSIIHVPAAEIAAQLPETIKLFRKRGLTVTVLGPTPELDVDVSGQRVHAAIHGRTDRPPVLPFERFVERQAVILPVLKALDASGAAVVLWVHPHFCAEGGCVAVHDGRTLYTDRDHLNVYGARLLKPLLAASIVSGQRSK